ncbi:MAG: DUF6048 family protein [Bacteroidales bacterium]|nr:DUF6048 family protein [Bacteroidales bacterium]
MSISSWSINPHFTHMLASYSLLHRSLLLLAGMMVSVAVWAQGSSIPTTSAVREQREAAVVEELLEQLPEGQKYRYPLLNGLSVSFNLFPPVIDLLGKDYGNYEGTLTLDLHHRFLPQVSAGVGYCNTTSDDIGYTHTDGTFHGMRYHSKMRPFIKVGMLYNFKYNDIKPNDFYGAVLRFGYAYSKADITNMGYTDAVWGYYGPIEARGLEFHSVWMEMGGFIKVQLVKHFSLGWDLTFRPFLHKGKDSQGKPYFVPGYGTTSNLFGFGFHGYFDF